LTELKKD